MAAVSVIIPTFNRAEKVVRAINSVLSQSFTDFEIIVVDDASTDGTAAALSRFEKPVTYIANSSNRGVSASRNKGIEASTAPLIAFLDSDDRWLSEKLAVQVAFFHTHPETIACQTDEMWIRQGRRVNPMKKHLKPSGHIFEASLKLCLVSPSAVMLKRSLLEKVGVFDEGLPVCEDYDLWLRIACRYPIFLIKQALVIKEGGHTDQLSARYIGMDRFRITALVSLITSGVLNKQQLKATLEELSSKCRIYGNGCIKRGKINEGMSYLKLPQTIKKGLYDQDTTAHPPIPSEGSEHQFSPEGPFEN